MKILCIGDVHIKLSSLPDLPILKAEITRVVEEHKPDAIVLLGDLHNDFEWMHLSCWDAIIDFFMHCKNVIQINVFTKRFYYIPGNHDYLNNTSHEEKKHWFRHLNNDFCIIDDMEKISINDMDFVFTNYMYPGKMIEKYHKMGYEKMNIRLVFAHQEFMDIPMGAIRSKKGDVWPEHYPPVSNGHIHDHIVHNGNIYCAGSPRFTGFGETGQRYLSLWDVTPDSIAHTSIPINMPRKETLTMSVLDLEDFLPNEVDFLRILLVDTPENIDVFKKTIKWKDLQRFSNLKVVPKPIIEITKISSNEGFDQIIAKRATESGVGDTFKELLDAFIAQKL